MGPFNPGTNYYMYSSNGGFINGFTGPFTVGSPDSAKPYYPYMNSASFVVYDRNVDIYMSCHDNVAITGYCLKEAASLPAQPGLTDPAWVAVTPVTPLSTNVLFALSPSAGFKNVYVWFRDAAGNISNNPDNNGTPSRTFQLILDTGPPTSFTINAISPVTSRKTDITLTATDDIGVTAYKIDEPPFYSSGWVAVAAAKNFSKTVYNVPLSKNPGDKTVKAWVKDAVGNVSAVAQAVVRFNDASVPSGGFTITQPAGSVTGFFNSPSINMTLTASDIESDVTHYYIREGNGSAPVSGDTGWRSFPSPLQQSYSSFSAVHTIGGGDGSKSIFVWFKDAADNVGAASDSPRAISIDTQPPLAGNAEPARWTTVGPEVISANWAHHESVFVYNGVAYCAFIDYSKSWKISVKKFDGTSWVAACPAAGGGSAGGPYPSYSKGLSLFVYNNIPYVAYSNYGDSYRGFVLNAGGSAWSVVGGARFSSGAIAHPNINFIDGRLYVAFRDDVQNGKATVVYHDSTAGWVTVGNPGFTSEPSDHPQIYKFNDKLRVDYQPQSAMDTVKTMQYDNGSWTAADNGYPSSWIYRASPDPVNGSANGSARFVFNSVPYVILMDPSFNNYGGKATVKKFDGSSWVTVGDPGFSNGDAFYPSIGVFNGVPYATYEAGGPGWRASVAKYETVTKNGIIINDGAKLTTVRQLKMKIFGTDKRNITPDYPSGVDGYFIKCNNSAIPLGGDPVWLAMPAAYSNDSPATQEVDFMLPANEADGLKNFYLWFKDKAGNVSSAAQKSIKFDTHPPVEAIAGSISIAGPHPELVITREVMLQLNAESGQDTIENEGYYDIKVSHYFLGDCNPGTTIAPPTASSAWKPVSTPVTPYSEVVTYTLTSGGDGTKEIYVWYKDIVGNMSLASKCVTFLDTSVPHGSFTINGGAEWSNSPLLTLNLSALSATAVSGYFISTDSEAPSAAEAGWHPVSPPVSNFSANVPYSLERSYGVKNVYVWYKSTSNVVSAVSSDTIKLDCEAPVPGFGKMKKVTIAGCGLAGNSDGPALSAKFNYPTGIAFDSKGNLYVADDNNHKIRKMDV
ncbi:MAG TPA: hypothetical protein PK467_10640, partial [Candidatus Wallbacteria bacterium]|nr:hypothetical protein [Candidatus Wallbacteria bacterium]